MGKIVLTSNASSKLKAISGFYETRDEAIAERAIGTIVAAFQILRKFPEAGRPWRGSLTRREIIIPFGEQGFVSLYEIDREQNEIVILAIRQQREAGYSNEGMR